MQDFLISAKYHWLIFNWDVVNNRREVGYSL